MPQVLNISIILVCFGSQQKGGKQLNLFCRNHFRNLMNKKFVVQLDPPVFGQVNLGQWSSSSFSSRRSWAAFFGRLCTPQVQVISAEGKGLKHHHHHLQQLQQYHHHHILLILLTMITFITTDNFVVASHLKQFEHSGYLWAVQTLSLVSHFYFFPFPVPRLSSPL